MKFTDGCWLVRPGMHPMHPAQAYDIWVGDDTMTVYAPTSRIRTRHDTLNRPVVTVTYSSPMPDVIRVRIEHHAGATDAGPSFELHGPERVPVQIEVDGTVGVLTSGGLSVRVYRGDQWRVDFVADSRVLTSSPHKGIGVISSDDGAHYVHEQLTLGVGEQVYGLGERFGAFVKNGQAVDIWNADGGTSSEQAYKNVPFYLTSGGYGVFVNQPERVSFEVGSENVSRTQFSVPGQSLEYFVIHGPTPKEVLRRYTALTGRPAQVPDWSYGLWMSTSFTNPDAAAWFTGHLDRLLAMGVDAFKTDFGERIPTDVVWHDRSDPQRMHNYYAHLYNKAVFDLLVERRGEGEAVVFARSATAGGQQFPVHWGGDCWSTYEAMAESLRGGLSLALSGFGYWSHDIGGFEGTPDSTLFKRWTAFGLLSSHSRLHGSDSYRVPWAFDEEAVDIMRHFTRLRLSLMPYLMRTADEAHTDGIPVMRPMLLEFPQDRSAAAVDTQYMLGESLLVAPVFSADGVAEYYLPEGTWTHLLTGEQVSGPRWLRERHDIDSLPLMVRPGAVIAVGSCDDRPDYDYADGVLLRVFEPADGGRTEVLVPRGGAHRDAPPARFAVERSGSTLRVTAHGAPGPWAVQVNGHDGAGEPGGAVVRATVGQCEVVLDLDR